MKPCFADFKRWVNGLSWPELQNALEFRLVQGAHETEVLQEMLDSQAPLPTPIHPRALCYRTPNLLPPTDGRNEIERVRRDRFRRPRLFRLNRLEYAKHEKYELFARKKCLADGERLSLGSTRNQIEADAAILKATMLVHSPDGMHMVVRYVPNRGCDRKRHVMRALFVASRGRFLTQDPKSSSSSHVVAWLQSTVHVAATERWFSLTMYLAGRFELALWSSYCNKKRTTPLMEYPWRHLEITDEDASSMIAQALRTSLREELASSATCVSRTRGLVRNTSAWALLENGSMASFLYGRNLQTHPPAKVLLEHFLTCHITDVGSFCDNLRHATALNLQTEIAAAAERALLRDLASDRPRNAMSTARGDGRKKAKRKKKNSKRKKIVTLPPVLSSTELSPVADSDEESRTQTDTLEKDVLPIEFPANDTTPRDRNRNVVMALSVVDSLLERAFARVGLEPSPLWNDEGADEGEVPAVSASVGLSHDQQLLETACAEPKRACEDSLATSAIHLQPSMIDAVKAQGQPSSLQTDAARQAQNLANAKQLVSQGSLESFNSQYSSTGGSFFRGVGPNGLLTEAALEDWESMQGFSRRQESILEDFLRDQERVHQQGIHEVLMASSTAASIDSLSENVESEPDNRNEVAGNGHESLTPPSHGSVDSAPSDPSPTLSPILVSLADLKEMRNEPLQRSQYEPNIPSARSLSSATAMSLPNSPYTKPSGASPLRDAARDEVKEGKPPLKASTSSSGSLFYRPLISKASKSRDDHDLHGRLSHRKSTDALSSYRNNVAKLKKAKDDHDIRHSRSSTRTSEKTIYRQPRAMAKPAASEVYPRLPSHFQFDASAAGRHRGQDCARSEVDLDGHDDSPQWQELRPTHSDDAENNTVTRDGSTTITSALSQRDTEDVGALREERNTYRDLCLTLGAEVSKLKNMLAAQRGLAAVPLPGGRLPHQHGLHSVSSFDPSLVMGPRARTHAAMSDAGYRVDHESQASEDDVAARLKGDAGRQISSGATIAGSDISMDHTSSQHMINLYSGTTILRDLHDPVTANGILSRLARDILQFLDSMDLQLRKQDVLRQKSVDRMSRLVNAVWPRAQVKLYGSHVTGLCLPSSDMDFVICLPAVHKNDVAVAPGALEGRNAINESPHKLLARKLKGESWIDPRSMKVIERTAVPVIKVSTKDIKAKMLQLDITFDGPGHHGLPALEMVSHIVEELPMIRPLVLVLKQFLLNRGLMTAYTGGLSSYCLFLMVARYLQEQLSSWGDCGSLLMGFLDFYGNHFDPRSTGISVRRREYFARPAYATNRVQPAIQQAPHATMWKAPYITHGPVAAAANSSFFRRNSFSDQGSSHHHPPVHSPMTRPPLFTAPVVSGGPHVQPNNAEGLGQQPFDHRMPYTFDPLWVEDPLSEGNNVGRNAFRYLQVQRAFSDAHRALVASLEWDLHSSGEFQHNNEYPLLKSLLQSEDVVFDL